MDWLANNWPWLAAVIAGLVKMIRDHIMISNHEERLDDIEDVIDQQVIRAAEQSRDIKHIRNTVDAIAKQQGINQEDIKELIKKRS